MNVTPAQKIFLKASLKFLPRLSDKHLVKLSYLITPFVKKFLRKKFMPQELLKKNSILFQESIELIEELPRDLINILHKFKEGRLKFNFEHQGLEKLVREIDRSSNRISFSLIIAALIIGSSLVLQQQVDPFIFGYSAIGIIGYLLASFLGFGLIISILRSGKWK